MIMLVLGLLIAFTLLAYSFFYGMEVAYISSNRLRLELESNSERWTDRSLKYLSEHQSQFFASLYLWARVASVFLLVFVLCFALRFIQQPWWISLLGGILLSMLLLFVSVNVTLKAVSKFNPTSTFRFFSLFLTLIVLVSKPFVALLFSVARMMNIDLDAFTPFSINLVSNDKESADESVVDGADGGDDVEDEVRMFQNALDFSNVTLSDCIVPRTEITAIDVNSPVEKLTELFVTLHYSRILVYKDNIDNILGYVHSLDLFDRPAAIKDMLNPLPVVPEKMSANRMLKIFLQQHKGMALVVDEFGGTAGIVTLEDIMEEIFGEIEDEHDDDGDGLVSKSLGNGEFVLSGRLEVEDVNDRYGLHLPISDEYITIAGLILYKNCILPQPKERILIENYEFSIVRVVSTRIELVRLTVKE